jgi:large subunit ribosomal protein L10
MAKKTNKLVHVSEIKKEKISELTNIFKNNKTLLVVSIKGLPSKQFQEIKKKIRKNANIKIIKKSLLRRALEESKIDGLKPLEEYVTENCALLYTNDDAFEISGVLSKQKSPQKAKAGQIAPMDIEVKAGPTSLAPGPDISALSSVGLIPKVEAGKISIMQNKIIVKEGAEINEKVASIMAKLDIIPFEVGIEPVAAFMDGKVYNDIKIDFENVLKDMGEKFSRSLAFAVEIRYYCPSTIDFLLSKAGVEEKVIFELLNKESSSSN